MASIVLVVQFMTLFLGLVMRALLVVQIHALRLGEAVDLRAGKTCEELLGELVRYSLALTALLILEGWAVSLFGKTAWGLLLPLKPAKAAAPAIAS